jgi:uncharacterized membrane protein YjfL (UPF0719 family)
MNQEMSGDEVLTMVAALVVALIGAVRWYAPLLRVTALGGPRSRRLPLFLLPVVCLALLWWTLVNWSAKDVREDARYMVLFLLAGAAWLAVFGGIFLPILGISRRDDALENRNPAAMLAIPGALLGAMLCFLGANIGEGPTIWTTLIPGALATGTLFVLLAILELTSGVVGAIVLDRDNASGLRLSAWLVATGLLLGRAVAGDYSSAGETLTDFARQGWPAAGLTALGSLLNHACRPTPQAPRRRVFPCGALPSMVYVAAAAAWVIHLGPW